MKKNVKKITAITTVASASVLFLVIGARAVFTDNPNDGVMAFGFEGTVDISVTDIDLDPDVYPDGVDPSEDPSVTGKEVNINPGDDDPYWPGITDDRYRPGTHHIITYHVENHGTKSVRTRHIISITMVDTEGETVEPTPVLLSEMEGTLLREINATYNSLFHKYYCLEDGTRIEVTEEEAFYVDEAGNRIKRIGECGLEPSKENIDKLHLRSRIIKIEYVLISNVLDGTSADMDHEDPYFQDPAEIEHATQITGWDYTFYVGLYHQAETNAYSETSVVAKDNKMYLFEGLHFDAENNVVGIEVRQILNGYFNDASEYAPDGKMYYAKDTVVNGDTITGSEVEYIDIKWRNASVYASDGNIYLVDGFALDENKQPTGTKVVKQGNQYYIDGTRDEVAIEDIMHWDASFLPVWNQVPRYYVFNADKTEYSEINGRDLVHWVLDDAGNPTYETIYNGADKYIRTDTGEAVEEDEIAHWDSNYNLIRTTEEIGGTEHTKLGNEGATIKVTIEIQAMQYRNTTNDDWADWTTFGSMEYDYTITPDYADDYVSHGK